MGSLASPHLRSVCKIFRYVAVSTEYGDVEVSLFQRQKSMGKC